MIVMVSHTSFFDLGPEVLYLLILSGQHFPHIEVLSGITELLL